MRFRILLIALKCISMESTRKGSCNRSKLELRMFSFRLTAETLPSGNSSTSMTSIFGCLVRGKTDVFHSCSSFTMVSSSVPSSSASFRATLSSSACVFTRGIEVLLDELSPRLVLWICLLKKKSRLPSLKPDCAGPDFLFLDGLALELKVRLGGIILIAN